MGKKHGGAAYKSYGDSENPANYSRTVLSEMVNTTGNIRVSKNDTYNKIKYKISR